MLDLNRTKIVQSREIPVTAGYSVAAEGVCLMQAFEAGEETVRPCTAEASKVFVGFSYAETMSPLTKSLVEQITAPAASPFTLTLKNTPITGQLSVLDTNDGTALTAGDPSTIATAYSISGNVITVNTARASHVFQITYRYSPSVADLQFNDYLSINSFQATDFIGSIGVIVQGEVYTDLFDASVNWAAAPTVKMEAGGLVGSGSGVAIPNAKVCHVPTIENPFLGIRF